MNFFEKIGRAVGGAVRVTFGAIDKYPNKLVMYLTEKSSLSKTEAGIHSWSLLATIAAFVAIGANGLVIMVLVAASIIGLSLLLPVWLAILITATITVLVTASYIFFGEKKIVDVSEEKEEAVKKAAKANEAAFA
jgi:uncharacterized membrane protein